MKINPTVVLVCALLLVSACSTSNQPQEAPTLASAARINQPKRLATVFISPTPNEAEQQATRLAASPTPITDFTPTPAPTATVYVGVFLGDSQAGAPVVDIGEVAGAPPTITPIFDRCPVEPATETFGTGWQGTDVASELGCAIEGAIPFRGVTQTFERGVMIARPEGAVWALTIAAPGRYWTLERLPEIETDSIEAPPGLLPPAAPFVLLWQGVDGVQGALGFAQFQAVETNIVTQRFEGGTLLYDEDSGQVFALMLDNEVYGPY